MKKIILILFGLVLPILSGCDLQPKIVSLPDTVGEFISARYPTLLADPNAQPEIYNSAASDYGVYAAPELYGSDAATTDDYVMYASVDDYVPPVAADDGAQTVVFAPVGDVPHTTDADPDVIVVPERNSVSAVVSDEYIRVPMYGSTQTVTDVQMIRVAAGDTLYALGKKYNTTVEELARMNEMGAPYGLTIGQQLRVPVQKDSVIAAPVSDKRPVASVPVSAAAKTRVAVREIKIVPGDTLYSVSRRYLVPVNDLAVMNNLSAPFTLAVGQVLRVPDLAGATRDVAVENKPAPVSEAPPQARPVAGAGPVVSARPEQQVAQPAPQKVQTQKISSDPTKKLPKLQSRSSSKFAWPVRGRVLSHYGAKGSGLVNDGINIGAARGTAVTAAENGVVAYAGNEIKGMGNLIIVQHSGGWMTVYAHLDSMAVRRGARVNVGQKIGTVGTTGKVGVPQLHFEIRKGSKPYDPMGQLKK